MSWTREENDIVAVGRGNCFGKGAEGDSQQMLALTLNSG